MPLPEDWRDRFAAMVTGQTELDGAWFTGSARLTPQQQIGIYRRQYELRFPEALEKNFPGLLTLDGGSGWLARYLRLRVCQSWTLEDAGAGMAEFMEEQGAPRPLIEMARMDAAVGLGFLADQGTPPSTEALMSGAALTLAPHVSLVRNRFDVHRWRSVALGGDTPDALNEGDYPVVVYRKARRMKHLVMPPAAFALLATIHQGLEAALAAAAAVDQPALEANVRDWFKLFTGRGLLTTDMS